MIIQSPNAREVKFLIPEVLAEIDRGAEPTTENIGALNLSKDIIAAGGVIAGLWEKPQFRPTLGTDLLRGANSTFESEVNDWDTSDAGVDITGGKLVFTAVANGDGAEITVPVASVLYATSITIDGHSGGSVRIIIGGTNGTARVANGTFPENITSGGGTTIRIEAVAAPATLNVTIATVFHKALWRIDAALSRRPRRGLDFVLLAQQNLLDVYESAIRSVVDVYSASTDALPVTPIEVSRYTSGLLGEGIPYVSYDGEVALTSVADAPELDFGNGNGSIGGWVRMPDVSGAVNFLSRFTDSPNNMIFKYDQAAGELRFVFEVGGVILHEARAAWSPEANRWYYVEVTFENGVSNALFIDAVPQSLTTDIKVGGVMNLTQAMVFSRLSATFSECDQRDWIQHNRKLTPAEVVDRFANPQSYPLATDQWGGAQLVGGWTNADMDTFVSSGVDVTQAISGGSGDNFYSALSTPTSVKVTIRFTLAMVSGSANQLRYRVSSNNGLSSDNTLSFLLVDGVNVITYTSEATDAFTGIITLSAVEFGITKSSMQIEGAIGAWVPDGISISQGLLLDASSNNLHGIMTGVDVWNAPDVDTPGYFLQQFTTPTSDRYLFAQFNPAVLAALAALRMGWLMWGSIYSFLDLGRAGFTGAITWPGVIKNTSDAGVTITESRHGLRPVFDVTLIAMGTDDWQDVQDLVERLQGCLHAFYIILDNAAGEPVLWQVRLDADVGFTWVTGDKESDTWEGVRFRILTEGR